MEDDLAIRSGSMNRISVSNGVGTYNFIGAQGTVDLLINYCLIRAFYQHENHSNHIVSPVFCLLHESILSNVFSKGPIHRLIRIHSRFNLNHSHHVLNRLDSERVLTRCSKQTQTERWI